VNAWIVFYSLRELVNAWIVFYSL